MNIISPRWRFRGAALLILTVTRALAREPLAQFFFRKGLQAKAEWRLVEAARHFEHALFLKGDYLQILKALSHERRIKFLSGCVDN